ncbi:MAG: hypothetical protein WCS88_03695 [Patescibacteria group bacterium]|jgi:hypothetical protein
MKKLLLTLLLVSLFFTNKSFAVPAMPAPICTFKGSVQSVSDLIKQTKFDRESSYYLVRINFDKNSLECDDQNGPIYKDGDLILTKDEYDKYPIKANDLISADIQFSGDEALGGYFLTNVHNLYEGLTLRGPSRPLVSSPSTIYVPAGIILFILLFVFLVKMKKRQNFVAIISIAIPVFLVLLWLTYIFSVYAVDNMFAVL